MRAIIGSHRRFPKIGDQRVENSGATVDCDTYTMWIKRETQTAEDIMQKYNVQCWSKGQSGRKWDWAGKVARQLDGRWSHEILKWHPDDTKVRGRPVTRWSDTINKFLSSHTGEPYSNSDWMRVAATPGTWSSVRAAFIEFDALH